MFDEDVDDVPKVSKISEKVPDQYVLAARGFLGKEVTETNTILKSFGCEAEIAKEEIQGAGITFFRSDEDLLAC